MRNIILVIFSFLLFLSFEFNQGFTESKCKITSESSAADFLAACADGEDLNQVGLQAGDVRESTQKKVKAIAERAIALGALFAIGAIVFSGVQYTTSYGNDEKIKKAKSTAIYALIGLVLLLTAFALVDTVVTFVFTIASSGS